MYRSILVPLDGTAFGEQALPHALSIARRSGAQLLLAHVHVSSLPIAMDVVTPASIREYELERAQEREYVEGVAGRLRGAADVGGMPVDARLLDGPVARTLAEQAIEARVDLVVMSTRAHTGLSRLWHHGVAAYLTRRLSVPVLMVRGDHAPAESGREPEFRHVLVPLGGSPFCEQVLDHAVALGRPFGARYTLLKVVAPPMETGYLLLGQDGSVSHFHLQGLRDEALRYLERVAGRLRGRGLLVETAVAAAPGAAHAIATFVERAAAGDAVDVVAMETHGMGGAAHLFTPSMVEQVIAEGCAPVLVHHAHPVAAAQFDEETAARMHWVTRPAAA
jgi:nucleotide-binding universal stress UspA family protein